PMMISRFMRSGNSPPWYLPEMKRSANRGRSLMESDCKDSKILVPKSPQAQANHLDIPGQVDGGSVAPPRSEAIRLIGFGPGVVDHRVALRSQDLDDAPVHFLRDHQARVAERNGHRVRAGKTRGRQGHDPVARGRDRMDLDVGWRRSLRQLVEE